MDHCKPSGQITASQVVTAKAGLLFGLILTGAAAAASTIDLYDHATLASGDRLVPQISFIATADNDRIKVITFPVPVKFFNGLYLNITTTAGTLNAEVYFKND